MLLARTSSLLLLRVLFLGWSLSLLPQHQAQGSTLYGFGNADTNDEGCNTLFHAEGAKCGTPGYCSVCSPTIVATDVEEVCSGRSYSLIITKNQSLFGVGAGDYLAVSSGSGMLDQAICYDERWIPLFVPTNAGAPTKLACGLNYSLVLTDKGNVLGLGYNDEGVFGAHNSNSVKAKDGILVVVHNASESSVSGIVDDYGNATVFAIAAGYQSALFAVGYGTVFSTGAGALKGTNSSTSNPRKVDGLCNNVDLLAVGMAHAMVRCSTSKDVYGWGDNTNYQLQETFGNGTLTIPTLLIESSTHWIGKLEDNVQSIHLGVSHSVIIAGTGKAIGRGSNSLGQLGHSSSVYVAKTWLPIDIGFDVNVTHAGAGQDYTLLALSHSVFSDRGTDYTNVLSFGSNSACALGIGENTSYTSVAYAAKTVSFASVTPHKKALKVVASEYRRSYLLISQVGTSTPSVTVTQSFTDSETKSFAITESVSNSVNLTQTFSKTITRTKQLTETVDPPPTLTSPITPTEMATETLTPSRSLTQSHSQFPFPRISMALVSYSLYTLNIYLDMDGNQYDASFTILISSQVDQRFELHGRRQTFGIAYRGYWASPRHFVIVMDKRTFNVTVGIATVSVAKGHDLRNINGTSLPSEWRYYVPVMEDVQIPENIPEDSNMPKYLLIIFIVGGIGIVLIFVIAAGCFVYTNKKEKERAALEERQKEAQKRIQGNTIASYQEDRVEDAPATTVTFSSFDRDASSRERTTRLAQDGTVFGTSPAATGYVTEEGGRTVDGHPKSGSFVCCPEGEPPVNESGFRPYSTTRRMPLRRANESLHDPRFPILPHSHQEEIEEDEEGNVIVVNEPYGMSHDVQYARDGGFQQYYPTYASAPTPVWQRIESQPVEPSGRGSVYDRRDPIYTTRRAANPVTGSPNASDWAR